MYIKYYIIVQAVCVQNKGDFFFKNYLINGYTLNENPFIFIWFDFIKRAKNRNIKGVQRNLKIKYLMGGIQQQEATEND